MTKDNAVSGHTAGPWAVEDPMGDEAGDSLWIIQETKSGQVCDWRNIALVCSDDPEDAEDSRPITPNERDANARLIAAAPELLVSVQELLEPLERASAAMVAKGWVADENVESAFDRARAAIAKATGGSNAR